jgi:hypothetical protein
LCGYTIYRGAGSVMKPGMLQQIGTFRTLKNLRYSILITDKKNREDS